MVTNTWKTKRKIGGKNDMYTELSKFRVQELARLGFGA